jgi:putative transposase
MARLPRLVVVGHPHHVIQRGNNGQTTFLDQNDRRLYLDLLGEAATQHGVAVHAYVLVDNEAQLLLTPSTPEGLSRVMQALGRRYVAAFNRRHERTGTLWEGRFRAGLLESERYFLACMRYIESAPLRAGLAVDAADWPWSSAAHHLGVRRDPVVTDHPLYWALGNTPFERELVYRALLDQGLPAADLQSIGSAARNGWALGSHAFLSRLSNETERPLRPRPRGRPRKALATEAR